MRKTCSTTLLACSLGNRVLSEVIDDQTGRGGSLDRNTGLETLTAVDFGPGAYVDRHTGLETCLDLQTGLGCLIDLKTGPSGSMLDAIAWHTGRAGYIDRRIGLATLRDANTLIDRNTRLGSFDMGVDFKGSRGIT